MSADGSLEDPPSGGPRSLVSAVGYCMQSEVYPGLRESAAAYLDAHGPARYFKRQRLAALDLPIPANPPAPDPPPAPPLGALP